MRAIILLYLVCTYRSFDVCPAVDASVKSKGSMNLLQGSATAIIAGTPLALLWSLTQGA